MKNRSALLILVALTVSACAVFIPMRVGPAQNIAVEITPERIALGKQLAEGIAACGSCHTTGSFEGDPRSDMYLAGDVITLQLEGTVTAPNITPDVETGIGGWTDGEIIRALTKGVNRDNKQLIPLMPWPEFGAALTKEEIYSIVAYLRAVPEPVNNVSGKKDLSLMGKFVSSTGMMYNMFAKSSTYTDYRPRTDTPEERGKRLVYIGKCVDCHSYAPKFPFAAFTLGEPLGGGIYLRPPGSPVIMASNLTPDVETGIGGFSDEELYNAIKYGKRLRPLPDTDMVRWPMMARIPNHTALTDEEIADMIAYLRSQEPINHDIDAKEAAKNSK